jgi:hypothetical protein
MTLFTDRLHFEILDLREQALHARKNGPNRKVNTSR